MAVVTSQQMAMKLKTCYNDSAPVSWTHLFDGTWQLDNIYKITYKMDPSHAIL